MFFRINDTLFTAPVSERILMVLPERVLLIWLKEGITVEVRPIVSELVEASKNGTLKEIFGAGTAAVVNRLLVSLIKMFIMN
jgi:branched-chain amino acid aminotransferase